MRMEAGYNIFHRLLIQSSKFGVN